MHSTFEMIKIDWCSLLLLLLFTIVCLTSTVDDNAIVISVSTFQTFKVVRFDYCVLEKLRHMTYSRINCEDSTSLARYLASHLILQEVPM